MQNQTILRIRLSLVRMAAWIGLFVDKSAVAH
jgi:hypothetical protein